MDLRKILASSVRQNTLRTLSEKRELQVMQLVSAVGSTYNELNRNLAILEKEGIIINEYPHQGAAWKSAHYSAKQKQPKNHNSNPSPKNTRTTKPCSLQCFRNTSPPLTANSTIFPVRTNQ
ncbi:MAG: hypothetical protein NWE96_04170 [Candidatus Bathyarchaeota archaeon]|nr:hypothetical protein [Candidatus Bathyarchaeota archaeon]